MYILKIQRRMTTFLVLKVLYLRTGNLQPNTGLPFYKIITECLTLP